MNPTQLHTFELWISKSCHSSPLVADITPEKGLGSGLSPASLEVLWCSGGPTAGRVCFHEARGTEGAEALLNRCSRSALNQITQPSSQPRARTTRMLIEWQRGQEKQIRLNKEATSWNLVSLWGPEMKGILTSLWRLKGELQALVWVPSSGCVGVFFMRTVVYCHVFHFEVCNMCNSNKEEMNLCPFRFLLLQYRK